MAECKIVPSQAHHNRLGLYHKNITLSPCSAKRASVYASTGGHRYHIGVVVGANERGCLAELLEPDGPQQCLGKKSGQELPFLSNWARCREDRPA
jgi:hypothetical protein